MSLAIDRSVAREHRALPLPYVIGVVWLLFAGYLLVTGWHGLALDYGDSDDAMRMVEVRGLLDGHGWYDLFEPRMDAPYGMVSHWSRLIDVQIASVIALAEPWVGRSGGELFARAFWPLGILLIALGALAAGAERIGGRGAALVTLCLALFAIPTVAEMSPGAIDHTGFELALSLVIFAILCGPRTHFRSGVAAGAIAALAFAVSFEPIPIILVASAIVAMDWALRGGPARAFTIGFGAAFGLGAPVLFLGTIAPARWFLAVCDTISPALVVPVMISALGLAGLAFCHPQRPIIRIGGLAILAAVGLVALLAVAPDCLRGPYAAVDPRLMRLWMDNVGEARGVFAVMALLPASAVAVYLPPFIAIVIGLLLLRRGEAATRDATLFMLLAAIVSLATTLWQVRGAPYSAAFALPILGAGIARWSQTKRLNMAAAAGGVALLNTATFGIAGMVLASALPARNSTVEGQRACIASADYAELARFKPGIILNPIDTGSFVLAVSPHSVVAGPYHRNTAGILDAATAFRGTPDEARAIALRRGADYVLLCKEAAETREDVSAAPDGFAARLLRGAAPGWLEPLPLSPSSGLVLWRIDR